MAHMGMMSGSSAGRGTGRSGSVSPLQMVLLITYAVIVSFLIVLPMYVDQVSRMLRPLGETTRFIIAVASGLLIAFILIAMIAVKASGQAEVATVDRPVRPTVQRMAPAQTIAAPVAAAAPGATQLRQPVVDRSPLRSVVTYPDLVEGGIFGDTYIAISPGKTLKLRSLVVEPEHLN
jgi:hypothetical protein